jgi:hypothetical protein
MGLRGGSWISHAGKCRHDATVCGIELGLKQGTGNFSGGNVVVGLQG